MPIKRPLRSIPAHCAHIKTASSLVIYQGLEGGGCSCIRDVTYITMHMTEAARTTIKNNQGNFWDFDSRRKKASFFTVIETAKHW